MNALSLLARSQLLRSGLGALSAHEPRVASPRGRRVTWILAGAGLLLWSLLAWGAYRLVDTGGDWLLALQVWPPALDWLQPWLEGGVGLIEAVALFVAWAAWAGGALALLLGAWLLPRALAAAGRLLAR
jgi:hypothetical protein